MKKKDKKPVAPECNGQKKKHGHGNGRTSQKCQGINYTLIIAHRWHFVNALAEASMRGLYGVIKTERSHYRR